MAPRTQITQMSFAASFRAVANAISKTISGFVSRINDIRHERVLDGDSGRFENFIHDLELASSLTQGKDIDVAIIKNVMNENVIPALKKEASGTFFMTHTTLNEVLFNNIQSNFIEQFYKKHEASIKVLWENPENDKDKKYFKDELKAMLDDSGEHKTGNDSVRKFVKENYSSFLNTYNEVITEAKKAQELYKQTHRTI